MTLLVPLVWNAAYCPRCHPSVTVLLLAAVVLLGETALFTCSARPGRSGLAVPRLLKWPGTKKIQQLGPVLLGVADGSCLARRPK